MAHLGVSTKQPRLVWFLQEFRKSIANPTEEIAHAKHPALTGWPEITPPLPGVGVSSVCPPSCSPAAGEMGKAVSAFLGPGPCHRTRWLSPWTCIPRATTLTLQHNQEVWLLINLAISPEVEKNRGKLNHQLAPQQFQIFFNFFP